MPQAAIQEGQIAWGHNSGRSRFLMGWGLVNGEKQGSGIRYQELGKESSYQREAQPKVVTWRSEGEQKILVG
jgi:hypothetical protein